MTDRKRILIIFTTMVSFAIIAISCGLLSLYANTRGQMPPHVFIGPIEISGLSKEDAEKKIQDKYESILKDDSLVINYTINSKKDEFKIKYSDIDASINPSTSVEKAYRPKGSMLLETLITSYFFANKRYVEPEISYNEGKVIEKLNELSTLVDKEPKDANIYLFNDKITKEEGEVGYKLKLENALKAVKNSLKSHFGESIEFSSKEEPEIALIQPMRTSDKLEGAEEIIASYTTEITNPDVERYVKTAVKAIHKVLVPGITKSGTVEFSFNEYLRGENGISEENNEGYNQVASTLYAALLEAGVENKDIIRARHTHPVDYIQPGLDVEVLGNKTDFKFKNTLECPLIIFASVKDGKVTIKLVGKKKDESLKTSIKIEVEQKYSPSVINVESQDLTKGQTKVITPGKEGVKVNVFRVTTKDGEEVEKKYLYNDIYKPLDAMVQIGPETQWNGNGNQENSETK